jgi:hypothetical protein
MHIYIYRRYFEEKMLSASLNNIFCKLFLRSLRIFFSEKTRKDTNHLTINPLTTNN